MRSIGPGGQTFTTAILGPHLYYADRETAERDAETFRQRNARDVEATKRKRKWKTEPATYSVLEVTDELLPRQRYSESV